MGGCKGKDPNLKFVPGVLWNFVVFFSQLTTLGINRVIHKVFPTGPIRRVMETGDKMKSRDENSREVNKRGMRNQTSFVT
jgi:hypothetical protein